MVQDRLQQNFQEDNEKDNRTTLKMYDMTVYSFV